MLRKLRYFLLVFGLLCALFFAWQHLLFFHPKTLDMGKGYNIPPFLKHTAASLNFDENTLVEILKFKQDDTSAAAKGVVLFFHGNRENVEYYAHYAAFFTRNGYEVWMPDYPGFGRSTGELSTEVLEAISLQLYQMARVNFRPGQVVIYGKSLGTGIASFLASERDCRHLILETPYYSLSSLTQTYAWFLPVPLLIRYNLQTGPFFGDITAPVTILAAGKDAVIPLQNTLRLLPVMKNNDAFYLVKNAGHNDLPGQAVYRQVVDSVLAR